MARIYWDTFKPSATWWLPMLCLLSIQLSLRVTDRKKSTDCFKERDVVAERWLIDVLTVRECFGRRSRERGRRNDRVQVFEYLIILQTNMRVFNVTPNHSNMMVKTTCETTQPKGVIRSAEASVAASDSSWRARAGTWWQLGEGAERCSGAWPVPTWKAPPQVLSYVALLIRSLSFGCALLMLHLSREETASGSQPVLGSFTISWRMDICRFLQATKIVWYSMIR